MPAAGHGLRLPSLPPADRRSATARGRKGCAPDTRPALLPPGFVVVVYEWIDTLRDAASVGASVFRCDLLEQQDAGMMELVGGRGRPQSRCVSKIAIAALNSRQPERHGPQRRTLWGELV
jgi:hypothetical protein